MTTGMLVKDIEASIAAGPKKVASTPRQVRPVKKSTQPPPPKKVRIDAELSAILEQVKDALAGAIGPIAGPVLKDSIKLWVRQASPSKANLPALARILCKEIDDAGLEREFMVDFNKICT